MNRAVFFFFNNGGETQNQRFVLKLIEMTNQIANHQKY